MASDLEQVIQGYENDYLLEQYFVKHDEYEQEALEAMQREIERRGFTEEQLAPYREEQSPDDDASEGEQAQFVPFDDTFSRTDLLLVHTILRDGGVAFYVDNPPSTVVPLAAESDRRYKIHVRADKAAEAHELLDQHFHREDGEYRLKHTSVHDRLRGFSFLEVRLSQVELDEEVTLELSEQEREAIAGYGKRLMGDIETVEQQRPVFHFDNVEPVVQRVEAGGGSLRMIDLLTVLEVLQIYCDEPGFPPALVDAAGVLLDLFERPE
ncbi:MAG: hypothetical protein GF331_24675 [Chitinivibrionales bacterium]|nr:hypothetical protein [Chitinivibrionales bacterium]